MTDTRVRRVRIGWLAAVVLTAGATAHGASREEQLASELDKANDRIRVLEAKYRTVIDRLAAVEDQAKERRRAKVEMHKLLERVEAQSRTIPTWRSAFGNLTLTLYGFVNANASYTTHRTNDVNITMFVAKEPRGANNDDEFGMTAKETRLGLKVRSGEPTLGATTTGIVEADFYGADAPENKPELMMRKAYIDFYWPDDDLRVIAGQTFEVISPLCPDTVDCAVLWMSGNIGYRRPMLAVSRGVAIGREAKLILQGALGRHTALGDTPAAIDEARDAGWPLVEARSAVQFPGWVDGQAIVLGVSGHIGEDEVDVDTDDGGGRHYPTWSVCTDVSLPLTDWLVLKGETFVGANLDAFLGGVGQGVDLDQDAEIRSVGGWVQLTCYPLVLATGAPGRRHVRLNVGYGLDDPEDDDLSAGRRSRNEVLYTNIKYNLTRQIMLGFEVSYWETSYKDDSAGDAVRLQSSVTYSF